MILYSASLSMFGAKVQIALIEKGIDYQLVMVPYDRDRGYEPKHPEVLRVNPKRQVPILIDGEVELFDSTQIFEYLEDVHPAPPLWPREPAARAVARQLEMKSDEVYFPHIVRLMGLQEKSDDPAAIAARDAASRSYLEMEARLTGREWLAGDYSFADIAFYMAALFGERMGAVLGPETPKLLAWRERMTLRPSVMPVVATMAGYLSSQRRPVPGWLAAAVR
ncbi:MAG: glutathione S-transferase family protein [Hyphomicrobiaceae bacterium]|nr:glutathione S-transferase family protein [Hyphomicrobiaceae bacterium]